MPKQFVMCVKAPKDLDLALRKVYRAIPDETARQSKCIKIVDDLGVEFLYPSSLFVGVKLTDSAAEFVGNDDECARETFEMVLDIPEMRPERGPVYTFGDEGNVLSIWLGNFKTKSAMESFLKPQSKNEDAPTSNFANDIGIKHYDSDDLESRFDAKLKQDDAFTGMSFAESYRQKASEAVHALKIREFNTVILLFGYNHVNRKLSRQPEKVSLVGTFLYVDRDTKN